MHKFRWFVIAIGGICIAMLTFVFFKIRQQEIPKNKSLDIKGTTVSGDSFSTRSLENLPSLVFFLSPECESCISETTFISNNIRELTERYNILLILTSDFQNSTHSLINYLEFINHSEVLVAFDENHLWITMYGVKSIPVCVLFDSNKKQVTRITAPLTSITQIDSCF
ncbi:MAG: TlpA family protein disulfide reductase [Paludibacteraceae bacterium]